MTDTKLTVQFLIPGSKPYTEAQCKEAILPNAGYDAYSIKVINKPKPSKAGKEQPQTEILHYTTRRCIPAVQVINMSNDAYKAMLDTPPVGYREHGWNRLYENARLKAHLDLLKYSLGAYDYTYFVLPD